MTTVASVVEKMNEKKKWRMTRRIELLTERGYVLPELQDGQSNAEGFAETEITLGMTKIFGASWASTGLGKQLYDEEKAAFPKMPK